MTLYARCSEALEMVVRLKDSTIDSIDETETKKLRLLKVSCKELGAKLTLELPEVLCDRLNRGDHVDVVIDGDPVSAVEKAKLYAEGLVFRVNENDKLQVVGTLGGLRFTLLLQKPTPSQRKTFSTGKFYVVLN